MKHIFGFSLIILALILGGCGEDEDTSTNQGEDNTPVEGGSTSGGSPDVPAGTSDVTAGTSDVTAGSSGMETTGTLHEVKTEIGNMDFLPEDLTISVGDTVKFIMTVDHNAVEVSQETYDNRNATPLEGGFNVSYGETQEITFNEAGVFYYVCQPHVTLDMVGTITVE